MTAARSPPPQVQPPPERVGDLRLLCVLLAALAAFAAWRRASSDPDAPPDLPIAAVRIDVNRASQAELSALPGVGPSLARRIDDERRRGGPFAAPEDLRRVPGIGPVAVARLTPHVRFGADP
jgi:competence protein ComEA